MTAAQKRKDIMKQFAKLAKDANRRNDDEARKRYAAQWIELATSAECRRAPGYIL